MMGMFRKDDKSYIDFRDPRVIACPLCSTPIVPSQMGLNGHFRGKRHSDLSFDDRRAIERELHERYLPKKK